MSAHTPGPWKPMESRDGLTRGLRGWHGPESVNVINWNGISRPMTEVGQANARLIASAPNLLAELENIANANPAKWDAEVRDQFREWAQSRARAAIAKATGETP